MREIPGVDHERLERCYLVVSAKTQIVAAEQLLREAANNLAIAEAGLDDTAKKAGRAVMVLRERIFKKLEQLP